MFNFQLSFSSIFLPGRNVRSTNDYMFFEAIVHTFRIDISATVFFLGPHVRKLLAEEGNRIGVGNENDQSV